MQLSSSVIEVMGPPARMSRAFWSFLLLLLLCEHPKYALLTSSSTVLSSGNETDRLALLAFKSLITSDPFGVLTSWNNSRHFCQWQGIQCDPKLQRVTVIDLNLQKLGGLISPSISNLTFLKGLNLNNNSFRGNLPQEIGRLSRLRHLNISQDSLQGKIPSNLSQCSDLRIIDLNYNYLVGEIPVELASLTKLSVLRLSVNNLTGKIPPSLGNLSSLTLLSIARNFLFGSIPNTLGRIPNLKFLQISQNRLSGTIPPPIYNLSSLYLLSVTLNELHGILPPDLGLSLPNLQFFYVARNQFAGPIPYSLPNASGLTYAYFSHNRFTGSISTNLGVLQNLQIITLGGNYLGTGEVDDLKFIDSLTNCSQLEQFEIPINRFGGILPNSIANLSIQLQWLEIGENQISGSIPDGIENLVNLELLGVSSNRLTGTIPVGIGKLWKLQILELSVNGITGHIPSSLGNITGLNNLHLEENGLWGSIPSSLGKFQNLLVLNLSQNKLEGAIPTQVAGLSSLSISLNLAQNSFSGLLPSEVGNLNKLQEIDISDNRLSGDIPVALGNCLSLEHLRVAGNYFQGTIPSSLSALRGIENLDLSHNNLTGQIPKYLETLPFLSNLNLSFNDFSGDLPKEGVFRNASAISVHGNSKLCGGIPELKLPTCVFEKPKRRRMLPRIVTISVVSVALCLILFSCCVAFLYWKRKSKQKPSFTTSLEDQSTTISYVELYQATNGFSLANLIGEGGYGSVFKGILPRERTVMAVKVLNLQQRGASRSFIAECEALRNVRHRNLIKILGACLSIDFKGNDFKALIFEFMPNQSLEEWLHPEVDGKHQFGSLNLIQRLNIAVDVTCALDYLHHQCHTPIAHCDVKPSNILLDDDMTAHVGDFGLAKLLHEANDDASQNQFSSVVVKGSIGYVAPEYGMGGQVSTEGDVYSFGILLLEMFTGKRPTDILFKDGINLHNFAKMFYPDRVMEIADPVLVLEMKENTQGSNGMHSYKTNRIEECLVSVIGIGLSCSAETPGERMQMRDVARKMHAIRGLLI